MFIELLKLAVEYQGEQHYRSVYHWTGTDLATQRIRDEEKRRACRQVLTTTNDTTIIPHTIHTHIYKYWVIVV